MATGMTTAWRCCVARRAGAAYSAWKPTDLLLPLEVRDLAAPNWPTAKFDYNHAYVQDHVWNWRAHLAPDDFIGIVSNNPGQDAVQTVLFAGYLVDNEWAFDKHERATITAVGPVFRLARDQQFFVYGQGRLNAFNKPVPAWYNGLACSFNAGAMPNRSADMAAAPNCYMFADAFSPGASYWRFWDAFDYLLKMYNPDQQYAAWPVVSQGQRSCSPYVQVDCEGLSLWAALDRLCRAASFDLGTKVSFDDKGQVVTTMVVRRRRTGPEQVFNHQPSGKLDILKTNLFAARIAEGTASCVAAPIVAGGRTVYEITVPLGRAWDPATLPPLAAGEPVVPPGDEELFKASEHVKKYCVGGSEFYLHARAGRLWDANTDGYYSGGVWNLTQPDMAALADEAAGSWPAMAFEPLRCLTRFGDAPWDCHQEVVLEVRFSDNVWVQFKHGFQLLHDRLGIWIGEKNLASIVGLDNNGLSVNAMAALLNNLPFEMRLTCSIAGPFRNVYSAAPRAGAGTAFPTAAFYDRDQLGQIRKRASSSRYFGTDLAADESDGKAWVPPRAGAAPPADGLVTLDQVAAKTQDAGEDRAVEACLTVEWIAPEVELFGVVKKIGGIEVDLGVSAGAAVVFPRIVGRVFRLAPDVMQTELILDSDRQMAVK